MKHVYLITTEFPYGEGEKTFILPELDELANHFEVTIISCARENDRADKLHETIMDKRFHVIWYPNRLLNSREKVAGSICAFFDSVFLRELAEILMQDKKRVRCLVESLEYYVYAKRMAKWLEKELGTKELEEAIIYSFWYYVPVLAATMLKKKHSGMKIITRAHGFDLYNERTVGGRQPFKHYMDSKLNKVAFIAETGYRYYIEKFVSDTVNAEKSHKYVVCRMGVKPTEQSQKSLDGTIRIISCSSTITLKRINLIIDGLSDLKNGIKVIWRHFGSGRELERLKRYAAEQLDNLDCIQYEFAGMIPNDQIRKYYANNAVDLFITTSETEGCPVSIQEALAAGIPVIGTAVGEIPSMVSDNGYLLPYTPSKREVANSIEQYAELSKEQIDVLRENALNKWKTCYNSEDNVRKMVDLIKKL